jgi:hypothetical protein
LFRKKKKKPSPSTCDVNAVHDVNKAEHKVTQTPFVYWRVVFFFENKLRKIELFYDVW